jgi:hypothetical protein
MKPWPNNKYVTNDNANLIHPTRHTFELVPKQLEIPAFQLES